MDWEYRTLTLDSSFSGDLGVEVSSSIHRESIEGWEFVGAFPLRINASDGHVMRLGVVYRRGRTA